MNTFVQSSNNAKILASIEAMATDLDVDLIDASILWCEKYNVEIDSIATIIRQSPKFKQNIRIDAEKLNYLPKTTRLDIQDE